VCSFRFTTCFCVSVDQLDQFIAFVVMGSFLVFHSVRMLHLRRFVRPIDIGKMAYFNLLHLYFSHPSLTVIPLEFRRVFGIRKLESMGCYVTDVALFS